MLTKLRFYTLSVFALAGAVIALSFVLNNHVYADSSTLIGMVNNGDIYVKSGSTTAPWSTRLTTGENATQLEMYADRVAFVDGSNNLWLKQGLTGQWYEEMGNVQSYALTENGLLVLQTGGNVWYKSGSSPTSQWDGNLIANNGAQVYLSPGQMVIIDTSGNLLGKELATLDGIAPEGSDGAWYQIAQNVTQAAITDSRLVYIDNQHDVYGKDGPIWSAWWRNKTLITNIATHVYLSGTRYCYVQDGDPPDNDVLNCANDFSGSSLITIWYPAVDSFALSPGILIVNGIVNGGSTAYFYGLDYTQLVPYSFTTSSWDIVSNTATEMTTNGE